MISVAIANQKGGVGKTTVALGIAEAALVHSLRVLVVDCDPQANATAGLGVDIAEHGHVAEILEGEIILTQQNIKDYAVRSSWLIDNLNVRSGFIDVLCSHPRLAHVEVHIASDPIGSHDRLSRAIDQVRSLYDLILFDCPPSMGLLSINALFAAEKVVVVSAASAWSSDGVDTFIHNVGRISARRGGQPEIAGIIVNNVGRTRDAHYWESEIANKYALEVVTVHSRTAIAEASAMSCPLHALGVRPGAREAISEFNNVFYRLIGINSVEDIDDSRHTRTADQGDNSGSLVKSL